MWKKALVYFLIGIFFVGFFTPTSLKAYTFDIGDLFSSATLGDIVEKVRSLFFYLAVILVPLMLIVAGYLFMTAGGNPQQVAQARKIVNWTLIGLFIILLSQGIIVIIKQAFGLN